MKKNIIFTHITLLALIGCSSTYRLEQDQKGMGKADSLSYDKSTIRIENIEVTWEMIEKIITARGGKSPTDLWHVDQTPDGDIRIKKETSTGVIYPPGAAVEFWYQDDSGNWIGRPTA